MTYRQPEFKTYFVEVVGAKPSSYNTYNSYLQRIDRALGGLDEAIQGRGTDATMAWGEAEQGPPFDGYPSHARSVLRRYLQFHLQAAAPAEEQAEALEDIIDEAEPGLAFRLENEMQAAVRKQLANLDGDLKVVDEGKEWTVATGRIDIVAEDAQGRLVAIELKAGRCPPGAVRRALWSRFWATLRHFRMRLTAMFVRS